MSHSDSLRLHHIALGTRDVDVLAAFYRDVLQLNEQARHSDSSGALRSIWLELGGCLLMIERTEESPRVVQGIGAGPFLIAFAVTPDGRADLESRLARAGCPVESRTAYTSYTRDLDGNRIAISHYPLPSAEGPSRAARLE